MSVKTSKSITCSENDKAIHGIASRKGYEDLWGHRHVFPLVLQNADKDL